MSNINDGPHRRSAIFPERAFSMDRAGYTEFSRTGSGWVISNNPKAKPDGPLARGAPAAPRGTRFFPTREEILPWALDYMRERFMKGQR